jgi:tripartite-type tricarboxylate transporter receptor subunit TctC
MHGFTPGANVDLVARLGRGPSEQAPGQPIVVESRPGAGGTTSAAIVARAAPDGGHADVLPGGHAVSAAIYKQLPYNSVAGLHDFISMLTDFPFISSPIRTISARSIRMSSGPRRRTKASHLRHRRQRHRHASRVRAVRRHGQGGRIQHVPIALAAGESPTSWHRRIDFQMDTPTVLLPFIKDGRLRPIAVTGSQRFFARAGRCRPYAEAGVPGYVVTSWLGVPVRPDCRRRSSTGSMRRSPRPGRARRDRTAAGVRAAKRCPPRRTDSKRG